jgi:hypothetical protein
MKLRLRPRRRVRAVAIPAARIAFVPAVAITAASNGLQSKKCDVNSRMALVATGGDGVSLPPLHILSVQPLVGSSRSPDLA